MFVVMEALPDCFDGVNISVVMYCQYFIAMTLSTKEIIQMETETHW